MPKLYLVRHGFTNFNMRHIIQGWVDSPLTERGIKHETNGNVPFVSVVLELCPAPHRARLSSKVSP